MFNRHETSNSKGRRPFLRSGKVAAALAVASVGLFAAPAYANTTNPTSIHIKAVVNGNGSTTVTVNGGWTWPGGQDCTGRYGTGWTVGWWGTEGKTTTLSNASQVINNDQGINGKAVPTGSLSPSGSVKVQDTSMAGQSIAISSRMNGQHIYTEAWCAANQAKGSKDLSGTYTATATYPSLKDVPKKICVITYDLHGGPGKPPGSALGTAATGKDYDTVGNNDNSVAKKQFTPETNCAEPTIEHHDLPAGGPWGLIGVAGLGAAGIAGVEVRRRRGLNRQAVTAS